MLFFIQPWFPCSCCILLFLLHQVIQLAKLFVWYQNDFLCRQDEFIRSPCTSLYPLHSPKPNLIFVLAVPEWVRFGLQCEQNSLSSVKFCFGFIKRIQLYSGTSGLLAPAWFSRWQKWQSNTMQLWIFHKDLAVGFIAKFNLKRNQEQNRSGIM